MENKILVVDDSRSDMIMIMSILDDYCILSASDGSEAMGIIESDTDIDLMILDLNMPKFSGFQVLESIQKNPNYRKIATIILTNENEIENEIKGLGLGAIDYIRKPLNIASLRKRIELHINLKNAQKSLEKNNSMLEKIVEERTEELILTRDIAIHALNGLLEVRNIESGNHTKRTQWMMKTLCDYLSTKEKHHHVLTRSYIQELFNTAPLHDIGKVGIPDCILLKPGKLTDEEFEIMKQHTEYGVNALRYAADTKNTVSFIKTAIEIVETHHEKYDGTGYPKGLKGEEIPLCGRLMAIIDVYDALVNKRVYKPAITHEDALQIIINEKGRHFDPDIVDAFLEVESAIREIANKYVQQTTERE